MQGIGKVIFVVAIIIALGILLYTKTQKDDIVDKFDKMYDKYSKLKGFVCRDKYYKRKCTGSETKTNEEGISYTEKISIDFNEYTYGFEFNFSNSNKKIVGDVYLKEGSVIGNYIDANNNVGATLYYIGGGRDCIRISPQGMTNDLTYLTYCNEAYDYFYDVVDRIDNDLK